MISRIIIKTGAGTAYSLTAENGSYTLTGSDATFQYNRVMPLDTGSYTLTGSDATFQHNRAITAENGSYSINGSATTLQYSGAPTGGGSAARIIIANSVLRMR